MNMTADLRAQIVKDMLSQHEEQLFLRWKAGKSLDTLAKLYRQYEGPNGVREKVHELEGRIAAECHERLQGKTRVALPEPVTTPPADSPAKPVNRTERPARHARKRPDKPSPSAQSTAPLPSAFQGWDALLTNADTTTLRLMLDRCRWETQQLEHALARSY